MESTSIPSKIISWLGDRADRWTVVASIDDQGCWVVQLEHPASAGLGLETGAADEADAAPIAIRMLESNGEIAIASASPRLEHADLCLGVRTLAMAFQWHNREVAGVTFLMFEHGHLTERETAWLAGFVGHDAPSAHLSPLG